MLDTIYASLLVAKGIATSSKNARPPSLGVVTSLEEHEEHEEVEDSSPGASWDSFGSDGVTEQVGRGECESSNALCY